MIEIRITKEIGNFKPRFLGPFTLRQCVCLVIAVPICIFIYTQASKVLPGDIPGFLCAIPGVIAWLFGWFEPYGMSTEKFLRSVAVNILIAPSNRRYKTANTHEELLRKIEENTESEPSVKKVSGEAKREVKWCHKISKNAAPEYYL